MPDPQHIYSHYTKEQVIEKLAVIYASASKHKMINDFDMYETMSGAIAQTYIANLFLMKTLKEALDLLNVSWLNLEDLPLKEWLQHVMEKLDEKRKNELP